MQELTTQATQELKQIAVESAAVINSAHERVLIHCEASQIQGRAAREQALVIGAELEKVKLALGHGKFTAWIRANCTFSHETARRYMAFSNSNHGCNLSDDLSLRQAMIELDIIPGRPREGGGTFRGSHIPSVYDPLNSLTKLLGAADSSGTLQPWESDPDERSAVQRQYKPKLEEFILRVFGVKIELRAVEG